MTTFEELGLTDDGVMKGWMENQTSENVSERIYVQSDYPSEQRHHEPERRGTDANKSELTTGEINTRETDWTTLSTASNQLIDHPSHHRAVGGRLLAKLRRRDPRQPFLRRPTDHNDEDSYQAEEATTTRSDDALIGRGLSFACPFFRNDPRMHKRCAVLRWTEVHRVKEHVYKHHALPPQCQRCWSVFKTIALRDAHLQVTPPCKPGPRGLPGMSLEQEAELRSRKRGKRSKLSSDEKWRRIYAILFPTEDPASIPSPYLPDPKLDEWLSIIDGFASFSERELPQLEVDAHVRAAFLRSQTTLIDMFKAALRDGLDVNAAPPNESPPHLSAPGQAMINDSSAHAELTADYSSQPDGRASNLDSLLLGAGPADQDLYTEYVDPSVLELNENTNSRAL